MAIGLLLLAIGVWFFIGKFASANIDIESTVNSPQCLTFRGHGLTSAGDIYILGTDGEQYDMPLTTTVSLALPITYPLLEATAANLIEDKFCLQDGAIEVDIEGGKYVNITIHNF